LFSGSHFNQHADFGTGVDVSGDHSVPTDFHPRVARYLDVLADLSDHGHAVGFEIRFGIRRQTLGNVIGKSPEHFVPRDEVGLAIDLDQDTEAAARRDVLSDNALAGLAGAFGA